VRMLVFVLMAVPAIVRMRMTVTMVVAMSMIMVVIVVIVMMMVSVVVRQVHVELNAADLAFLPATGVQVVIPNLQFRQLALQLFELHAQINQRAEKHVPADAAENIQI